MAAKSTRCLFQYVACVHKLEKEGRGQPHRQLLPLLLTVEAIVVVTYSQDNRTTGCWDWWLDAGCAWAAALDTRSLV